MSDAEDAHEDTRFFMSCDAIEENMLECNDHEQKIDQEEKEISCEPKHVVKYAKTKELFLMMNETLDNHYKHSDYSKNDSILNLIGT